MKNRTGGLLDFIEARLEMTYAYGLSNLDWDRLEVAKQILKACKEYLVFRDGSEIDIPQAHKQFD